MNRRRVTRLLAVFSFLLPVTADEPPRGITAACFSPAGDQLITAGQDGVTLRRWPSLEPLRTLSMPADLIHDVVFNTAGTHLAVAGGNPTEHGVIQLLGWPGLAAQRSIEISEDVIWRARWLDDAELLAASFDGSCCRLNIATGRSVLEYRDHSRGITSLLTASNSTVLTGALDHSIRLWNSASGVTTRVLNNHTGPITDLAARPAGTSGQLAIASAAEDNTVRLWYPRIGRMVRFVRLETRPRAIAWNHDGSLLAVACDDGKLILLDPLRLRVLETLPTRVRRPAVLRLQPTGQNAFIAGLDAAQVLDLRSGKDLQTEAESR